MGRRWRFWPLTGFLTAAVRAPWLTSCTGERRGALAGVFCAVNESVWEHMKLLFFPVFLFTAVQFCVGRAGRPAGGPGGQRHGGTGPDPHIVLYLHRHLGRSRALGGRGHLLSVGGGDILDGRSASPSAAALEDGMPGGGTGVAVGAGVPVCLVDLFTAPHRPVPGPSDGTLRDTVEKRRCLLGQRRLCYFL